MHRAIISAKPKRPKKVNARRLVQGRLKRMETRGQILQTAFQIMGWEKGRMVNIEEFCRLANVSRGTFYNYFPSIESMLAALANDVSHTLYEAVFSMVAGKRPTEDLALASRYYMRWAYRDPAWAWVMVNTSLIGPISGAETYKNLTDVMQAGIVTGDFNVKNAQLGCDIVLGSAIALTLTILRKKAPADYAEQAAKAILQAVGVSPKEAGRLVSMELPPLNVEAHLHWTAREVE